METSNIAALDGQAVRARMKAGVSVKESVNPNNTTRVTYTVHCFKSFS